MSRSSLNRGFYTPDVPKEVETTLAPERQERALEQYGNTSTYNFENVLRQNVLTSSYYHQSAAGLDNWQDLVDQIYYRLEGGLCLLPWVRTSPDAGDSEHAQWGPGCAVWFDGCVLDVFATSPT